jgi:ribonuclease J
MGEELASNSSTNQFVDIPGVTTGEPNCDAVFFTHYHGDHIGMISSIHPNIPLYLGEVAKEIFLILQTHLHKDNLKHIQSITTYQVAKAIKIGDISVTPYVVDHSAYDAYMLLIEAEGKKILHTGDFRNHGFRGKGLFKTIETYIKDVDVLITEGTTLSRIDSVLMTENELIHEAKGIINQYKYVYLLCSSTNVDRISAFYQATPRGKYFVCDQYQKDILKAVEKYSRNLTSLYTYDKALTYGINLDQKLIEQGFCMLIRNNNHFRRIMDKFDPKQSIIIYSMWLGYINDKKTGLCDLLKEHQYVYLHTSGHASKAVIKLLCERVNPKIGIIPIHSEKPGELTILGIKSPIILLSDGESFLI